MKRTLKKLSEKQWNMMYFAVLIIVAIVALAAMALAPAYVHGVFQASGTAQINGLEVNLDNLDARLDVQVPSYVALLNGIVFANIGSD